ncbi:MAG: acyl-CoA dehydrogenase family protein [Microbacteriaceae bacterium]
MSTDALTLVTAFLEDHPPTTTDDRALREARFDAGLAFPHFSVGAGGLGLPPGAAAIVERAFARAGAEDWSDRNVIGLGMAAPSLHAFGSDEQRALLRPLFTGDYIWCQLFSEPDAGSDLAGVRTTAVRDGDTWIVDGQKVWTTLAHVARWGLLLARTDPDAPRHRGLTYFLLDMTLPGVEVRPLRQITGEAEFNEVYMTGVRVPDSARLGPEGEGWRVALTTLMNERVALPDVSSTPGSGPIARAVETYRDAAQRGAAGPAQRDRLMELWVRSEVVRLTGLRAQEMAQRATPGPEGSIGKVAMAETNKAIFELIMDLLGPQAMLIDHYEPVRPALASVHGGADARKAFLRTRANSIEGGTSEILRNVIAERVLGLPK